MLCVILGHDGFDLDVAINLRALYRELGYTVQFSRTARPCDLLVIHRPPDHALDVSQARAVHVYDYVGKPFPALCSVLGAHPRCFVLASSRTRAVTLGTEFPDLRIQVLYPPVHVDAWASRLRDVDFPLVHIGNRKPASHLALGDVATDFDHFLSRNSAHVFGAGWDLPEVRAHGRVPVGRVSRIYARSGVSAGIMYQFQRGITISGRFWHAPLNGARLMTESIPTGDELPGVDLVVYSRADNQVVMPSLSARRALQADAALYWRSLYREAKVLLEALAEPGTRMPQLPTPRALMTTVRVKTHLLRPQMGPQGKR